MINWYLFWAAAIGMHLATVLIFVAIDWYATPPAKEVTAGEDVITIPKKKGKKK